MNILQKLVYQNSLMVNTSALLDKQKWSNKEQKMLPLSSWIFCLFSDSLEQVLARYFFTVMDLDTFDSLP